MTDRNTPRVKTCAIAVVFAGREPTFVFSAPEGEVRIIQLNLWRDGVPSPQWAIATDRPPVYTTVDLAEYGGSKERAMRAVFERGAQELMEGVGSLSVSEVKYGEVPPGFRQQYPQQGRPPDLHPGPHSLSVVGGYTGWLSFSVPE